MGGANKPRLGRVIETGQTQRPTARRSKRDKAVLGGAPSEATQALAHELSALVLTLPRAQNQVVGCLGDGIVRIRFHGGPPASLRETDSKRGLGTRVSRFFPSPILRPKLPSAYLSGEGRGMPSRVSLTFVRKCNNGWITPKPTGTQGVSVMSDDKNYSWKGSPNAGLVLTVLAVLCGLAVVFAGFNG